ncbi:MAG: Rv2578c family radical SAM protein [Acidimicrobiales bacterium]
MAAPTDTQSIRWRLAADESDPPDALFPDESAPERHVGVGEYRGLEFYEVVARQVINQVPKSSHMPFRHTINAYRGCSHACTYCFARPTHEFLGLGLGADFDAKIVVKVNAVERVTAELRSPRWHGEHIAMGTNTDPYQKAEGKYHLTRGIIEALSATRNPFSILTKSTLVLRDLDLLVAAAGRTSVRLNFSIGTLDRAVWRMTEPGTPRPDKRIEAVKRLNDAGVPCGVLMGPVLPGLSDATEQLKEVVDACVAAGAVSISAISLHLRPGVREHFLGGLEAARPDLRRLYETRFTGPKGPRAYQPKAAQDELAARVRRLVREAEGRFAGPRRVRTVEPGFDTGRRLAEQGLGPGRPPAPSPVSTAPGGLAPAIPPAEQLTLL